MNTPTATTCVIALGSNLQKPAQQVLKALEQIAEIPNTSLNAISNWYQSQAIGPGEQPDYINGAAQISTLLKPLELLSALQSIENNQKRTRTERWGPRTIDLDILLYGDQKIALPELIIPHPRMLERNFVVYPLYDLNPERILPNGLALRDCKEKLDMTGLRLVELPSSPTMRSGHNS